MKSIICKIVSLKTGKKQEGMLFNQKNSWDFDKLIEWVIRNCIPAKIYINPEKEITAIFKDRTETYYFKSIKK